MSTPSIPILSPNKTDQIDPRDRTRRINSSLTPLLDRTDQTDLTDRKDLPSPSSLCWYALRTRSRHEKQVRNRLAIAGIEPLLPTVVRLHHWQDRKKKVEVPLFSCYCFAQFSWQDRLAVLRTPGIVQIVGNGNGPEPVTEDEIQAIKALMASALPYDAYPYLEEGMAVQVVRGPLEGVHGILLRKPKPFRLVISINLIRQSAAVEIDADDVMPV